MIPMLLLNGLMGRVDLPPNDVYSPRADNWNGLHIYGMEPNYNLSNTPAVIDSFPATATPMDGFVPQDGVPFDMLFL